MLLLICEIAHSWMNFKLQSNTYEILFMNHGRNVSQSHYSKMVAPNHSLQVSGGFFQERKKKKTSGYSTMIIIIIILPLDFTQ